MNDSAKRTPEQNTMAGSGLTEAGSNSRSHLKSPPKFSGHSRDRAAVTIDSERNNIKSSDGFPVAANVRLGSSSSEPGHHSTTASGRVSLDTNYVRVRFFSALRPIAVTSRRDPWVHSEVEGDGMICHSTDSSFSPLKHLYCLG